MSVLVPWAVWRITADAGRLTTHRAEVEAIIAAWSAAHGLPGLMVFSADRPGAGRVPGASESVCVTGDATWELFEQLTYELRAVCGASVWPRRGSLVGVLVAGSARRHRMGVVVYVEAQVAREDQEGWSWPACW